MATGWAAVPLAPGSITDYNPDGTVTDQTANYGVVSGPMVPGSSPDTSDPARNSAFAYIRGLLTEYGLESLTEWAWEQIVAGVSADQLALDLRQRPEFQAAFPEIQSRKANGLTAMSPAEILAYRQAAGQILRQAGLPPGFYDSQSDYAALLSNDVSIAELAQRVSSEGLGRVVDAPQAVRDAFSNFFGVQGDAALAAFFLDPARATPVLQRMATQADIAGRARLAGGLNVNAARAEELARMGVTGLQAQQAAANVAERSGDFVETISETQDLTGEREGLNAALGIGDASALARRRQSRSDAFSGAGGAVTGQAGVLGLGVEER